MTPANTLLFAMQIDCESTQRSLRDPALGERSIRGLADILGQTGTKGTFLVIPGDIEVHAPIYQDLRAAGHEVGLHIHVEEPGQSEFMGDKSRDEQARILRQAIDRFAQAMGYRPIGYCPGYFSANDASFGVLEEVGLRHGAVSCPSRVLPQCSSVWAGSSLDPRFPHRHNRVLNGDVDFVDLPVTVDPESRLWGGAHPQDLRVELVDAKNHWHTIDKTVRRQLAARTPLCQVHALTHNTFEYGAAGNFRRETCLGMIAAARQIAERESLRFQPATLAEMAALYRQAAPLGQAPRPAELDVRGRDFGQR